MMVIKLTDMATIGYTIVDRRDQCNCKLPVSVQLYCGVWRASDSNRDYQSYKLIFPLEISVGHLSTSTQQLLLPLTLICTNHHQQIDIHVLLKLLLFYFTVYLPRRSLLFHLPNKTDTITFKFLFENV